MVSSAYRFPDTIPMNIISFLQDHRLIVLALHVLSMAIGLGGATVSDILFFRFLKDYRVSKKEEEVLHVLKDVVLGAIVLIVISGVALYLTDIPTYSASPMFRIKMTVTAVVVLNGTALHLFIAPYLIHLNMREHGRMGRNWSRFAFALGAVSVCSWYSAFLIAMLKSALPFTYGTMLTAYIILLCTGILGSQVVEHVLTNRARPQ